jgi:hypothetical protein
MLPRMGLSIARSRFMSYLKSATKRDFKVLPATENTFNENGVRHDDKCDRHMALKSCYAQSRQDIITLHPSQRKGRESVAKINDATNIAIGTGFVGMCLDVPMQFVDVTFSKRRKNDAHKISPNFLRGASGLDAAKDCIGWNAF